MSLGILLTLSSLKITSSIFCSQSIFQALVPVSGDSSEESNQRPSKRAGKDKGSSAKRSNSAVDPTFNICFTNSQEFASLLTYSELENNENTAVHYER